MCLLTPLFFLPRFVRVCVCGVSTSLVPCPPPPETQGGLSNTWRNFCLLGRPACLPLPLFLPCHPIPPSPSPNAVSDSDRRLSLIVGEISGGTCRTYSLFSLPHLPSRDQHSCTRKICSIGHVRYAVRYAIFFVWPHFSQIQWSFSIYLLFFKKRNNVRRETVFLSAFQRKRHQKQRERRNPFGKHFNGGNNLSVPPIQQSAALRTHLTGRAIE